MPKPTTPRPKFPGRCRCGRFHGCRYHDYRPGVAPPGVVSCLPLGSVSYDRTIYEYDARRVDLSQPPHLCHTCLRNDDG